MSDRKSGPTASSRDDRARRAAADGAEARAAHDRAHEAEVQKTARLRALRLAKEAVDAKAAEEKRVADAAKRKPPRAKKAAT